LIVRTAFLDEQHEAALERDGCVVVEFLDRHELLSLRQGVEKLGFGVIPGTGTPIPRSKLRISVVQGSADERNRIFEELSPLLQRAAGRFLRDYALLRIGVFDKLPGGSEIGIHQHSTLVDESKYRSVATWLPLTDTSIESGTLYVIKGSHEFSHHVRSYNDFSRAFQGVSRRMIERYSTPVLLKAGQAVIFDDRLVHWSPRNRSSGIRTALQLELIPNEAELIVYYRNSEHELLECRVDRTVYRQTVLNQERPGSVEPLGTMRQPLVIFRDEQFLEMARDIHPVAATPPDPFLPRLLSGIRQRLGRWS
jgi:hypothetical protein